MFAHIIKIGQKYYIRRWELVFRVWDATDDLWWSRGYRRHWTAFESEAAAREAFRETCSVTFVGWL